MSKHFNQLFVVTQFCFTLIIIAFFCTIFFFQSYLLFLWFSRSFAHFDVVHKISIMVFELCTTNLFYFIFVARVLAMVTSEFCCKGIGDGDSVIVIHTCYMVQATMILGA